MRRAAVGLALLLAAPIALAAQGDATLAGEVAFERASLDAILHSLLLNDTSGVSELTLVASHLVVHEYAITYANVPGARLSGRNESSDHDLHHARVRLANGTSDGWLGIYGGSTSLRAAPDVLRLTASLDSSLSNGVGEVEDEPRAGNQVFIRALRGPHLQASLPASLALEGAFAAKVRGPDLVIGSDEGTTTFATGEEETTATVVARWLMIEATDASMQIACECDADALLATPATLDWEQMRAFATRLVVEDDRATYVAANETIDLEGRFTGTLGATPDATAQLSVAGDVASTSARVTARPAAGVPPAWILLVGLAAAGSAGALLYARRSPGARGDAGLTAEDLADLAARALEEGDPAQAAAWLRRARALAPSSARLMIEEAYALEASGQHELALTLYGEAAQASKTGEADLLRARLLARTARPSEAAEALAAALARDAWLVLDLDEDAALRPLQADERVARAAAQARRALESDPGG
ncbi:MAG TPA: hypothetical protein VM370_01380 [Candidatus Thermoplasmatota archaeon]|nr:hypothetical protein [Candidatus Thermoplasmatota archaeon]